MVFLDLGDGRREGGKPANRNTDPIHDGVSDDVLDQPFQCGHIAGPDFLIRNLAAEKIVGQHLQHDDFDFRFEWDSHGRTFALEVFLQHVEAMADSLTKRAGKFVELLRLEESRFPERRRCELFLLAPNWTIGVKQRVCSRGPSNADGGQGVSIKLAVAIARLGRDSPYNSRVPSHQDRGESWDFKISVVPTRPLLGIGAPKIGFENEDRFVVVPRVRKGQGGAPRPWSKESHAGWQNIARKRAATEQLPRQTLQPVETRNALAKDSQKSIGHRESPGSLAVGRAENCIPFPITIVREVAVKLQTSMAQVAGGAHTIPDGHL